MRARVCVGVGAQAQARACSLINPAYNARTPYCLRPVWLHDIFRHYYMNGTSFEKNVMEPKICTLIFSTTSICNISHYKKNLARCCHKCENFLV